MQTADSADARANWNMRKLTTDQRGSANVYADLGYKSADEMLVKAQLVTKIAEILTERGCTQTN